VPTEQLTPWERWELAGDERTITVHWTTNSAYPLRAVEVAETPREVRVTVREEVPDGRVTMAAALRHAEVRLAGPLAGRPVLDGAVEER
jgi:hypothetical protein